MVSGVNSYDHRWQTTRHQTTWKSMQINQNQQDKANEKIHAHTIRIYFIRNSYSQTYTLRTHTYNQGIAPFMGHTVRVRCRWGFQPKHTPTKIWRLLFCYILPYFGVHMCIAIIKKARVLWKSTEQFSRDNKLFGMHFTNVL